MEWNWNQFLSLDLLQINFTLASPIHINKTSLWIEDLGCYLLIKIVGQRNNNIDNTHTQKKKNVLNTSVKLEWNKRIYSSDYVWFH